MNAFNLNFGDKATRRTDIASRAMLVQLSVGQWTARKLDRKVSAEVATQHGAKAGAGNYNKVLIARGALAAIAAIVAQARQDHAFTSLPWLQDGTRIIPVDAFGQYRAKMATHREAFEKEVRAFVAAYGDYVQDAREALGNLFNAADYPGKREVAQRFSWSITVLPMPNAADFRVDLDAGTVAALQADMQADVNNALHNAMGDVADRLHKVVKTMADKLAAYDPGLGKQGNPFRDSLVDNVRELVAVLPALNLTGDTRLAATIDDVRERLAKHEAYALREDHALRANVAKQAADIAADLAGWME